MSGFGRLPLIVAAATLSLLMVILFGEAVLAAWRQPDFPWLLPPMLIVLLALIHQFCLGLAQAWRKKPLKPGPVDGLRFSAVLAGALFTYALSNNLGLGPVVASALLGLLAALILPSLAVPIYCGSFVGMVCPALFCNLYYTVLAAAIAAVMLILLDGVLDGFGGKLGAVAFYGTTLTIYLTGQRPHIPPLPPNWMLEPMLLTGLAAALITWLISIRLGRGPVFASALVGLVAGIFFRGQPGGAELAALAFCASFAGMSAGSRFGRAWPMIPAGALCGLFFYYSASSFGGAGGKLGAIAFGCSLAVWGLNSLQRTLLKGRERQKSCPCPEPML